MDLTCAVREPHIDLTSTFNELRLEPSDALSRFYSYHCDFAVLNTQLAEFTKRSQFQSRILPTQLDHIDFNDAKRNKQGSWMHAENFTCQIIFDSKPSTVTRLGKVLVSSKAEYEKVKRSLQTEMGCEPHFFG